MAAVELAFVLPLLTFLCMMTIDFSRVIYALIVLQNCARNGALYEFYSTAGGAVPSNWSSLGSAVQADAGNLTVSVPGTFGGNANPYSPQASTNNYVTVTVQCQFPLLTNFMKSYMGSSGITLTQAVSMPMPASTGPVP